VENTSQILKQYIIEEFLSNHEKESIKDDFPLIEEGIIDSMGIFMLINFINEQFQVEVRPEDVILENFETLDAISNMVNKRI
jgi:acyl carrier protein